MIRDGQMLRAGLLTPAALDAVGGPVSFRDSGAVILSGFLHLPVAQVQVHGGEDLRDGDLLRCFGHPSTQ